MTVLVRDADYYRLDSSKLEVLLMYAEADLLDDQRRATAFTLLKAILRRGLKCSTIHDVMGRVRELSITGEHEKLRLECRQVT